MKNVIDWRKDRAWGAYEGQIGTLNKYNIITTTQSPIKLSQFSKKDQAKIKKAPKQVNYVPLPVGAAAENKVVKTPKTKTPKTPDSREYLHEAAYK